MVEKGCENCKRCFADCKNPFPDEYLEGGAEACGSFSEETDQQTIYNNLVRMTEMIRDDLAKDGIFQ